jgi:hypothetical protein
MTAGPFHSEAQAQASPLVRAAFAAAMSGGQRGLLRQHNHQMLCAALTDAGVALGEYDHEIVTWLASWEPHVVVVIAGLIARASAGSDR